MADPSVAPYDYTGNQNLIGTAYQTALARLQEQQSQLYSQYGFKDGTTQLDPSNQYGTIQQLLHSEGASLDDADKNSASRGLSMDEGLGAQRARAIRYAAGAQKNTVGQQFQTSLTDIGNSRVDATQKYNTDSLTNSQGLAQYNATTSAYDNALAAYNESIQQQAQQQAPLPGTTPATANWNDNPSGYNPGVAHNMAGLPSPKPGKVLISKGRVIGGV